MKLAQHIYADVKSQGAGGVLLTALTIMPRYLRQTIAIVFTWLARRSPCLWSVVDWLSLFLVDCLRLFSGYVAASNLKNCRRPEKPLRLYEFEGCPFCRKVRETLSVLALDCMIYPCPRETLRAAGYCKDSRFRPTVKKFGGALMFPFLEDPNTNVRMYHSDEIIKYLWAQYGSEAKPPLNYRLAQYGFFEFLSLSLTTFCRPLMRFGILRIPSTLPKKPLELWACEASAPARRVREALSSLELPYYLRTTAIGSGKPMPSPVGRKRAWPSPLPENCFGLACYATAMQIYLRDPNTNAELGNAAAIVHYLEKTYKAGEGNEESWISYGGGLDKEE